MSHCENCGNETSNPKFCSRKCAVTVNNRKHPKRASSRVKDRCCEYCGASLERRQGKYCNAKHQQAYQRKLQLDEWLSGGNPQGTELPPIVREFLLEESSYSCSMCAWSGVNPVTGKTVLQIDHKDGHATNNTRENLRVMCPNCHAMTPTFGSLNKGNGRTWRYG